MNFVLPINNSKKQFLPLFGGIVTNVALKSKIKRKIVKESEIFFVFAFSNREELFHHLFMTYGILPDSTYVVYACVVIIFLIYLLSLF